MISRNKVLGIIQVIAPFIVVCLCSFYDWRVLGGKLATLGYILFALGAIISIMNFYLSFLRYPLHRVRHGKDAEYRWVSGIPLFGILSVIGLIHIPKSLLLNISTFLLLIIDTGGIQWFVVSTWKDNSFWNTENIVSDK